MSEYEDDDDAVDPAEARAAELLRLVATVTPEMSAGFSAALLARARAQGAVAPPLRAFGGFLLALVAAAEAAARTGAGEGRR